MEGTTRPVFTHGVLCLFLLEFIGYQLFLYKARATNDISYSLLSRQINMLIFHNTYC